MMRPYVCRSVGQMNYNGILLDDAQENRSLQVYLRSVGTQSVRNMTEDRWHSVDEVAAYLGVKRDTLYKWIDRKNMPAHKVGRLWKFKLKEVDKWVKLGSHAASSDRAAQKR